MLPVVDRLEKEYSDRVEFRHIDADSADGNAAFRAYQLIGHPGFVLLATDGTVLWKGQGVQAFEEMEVNLISAFSAAQP